MTAHTNPESWHSRWRVVPVEPTTGMLIAGNHCQPGDYSAALVWQSMLAAAERSTELAYTRPLPQDMPTVPPAQRALDMLAGLHPCLTTDDPTEMAKQIFDAVMAERAEYERQMANHARNLEGRDALIARWRAGMRSLISRRMGAEAIRERLQSIMQGTDQEPSHA